MRRAFALIGLLLTVAQSAWAIGPYLYTSSITVAGMLDLYGLTYDPVSGHLFGVTAIGTPDQLYEFTTSGALIASHPLPFLPGVGGSRGLAFDTSTGTLYLAAGNGDLYEITTSGALVRTLPPLGPEHLNGVTYDAKQDTLFVYKTPQITSNPGDLLEVNKLTGAVIRTLPPLPVNLAGLAHDGQDLIGFSGNTLMTIDPSPGNVVDSSPTGTPGTDFSAMTYANGEVYAWNHSLNRIDVFSTGGPCIRIDFEPLMHGDALEVNHAPSLGGRYKQHGFQVIHDIGSVFLSTYGTQHAFFSGSTAMHGTSNPLAAAGSLTVVDAPFAAPPLGHLLAQTTFTPLRVLLTERDTTTPAGTSVTFTGYRPDNTTVSQTFILDGNLATNESFALTGFDGIKYLEWSLVQQIDDICLLDPCQDGLDNDGDGLIDADDPDCSGIAAPGEHLLQANHFKVYDVDDVPFDHPVELEDQFGAFETRAGPVDLFANPVDKNAEGTPRPEEHQKWYPIVEPQPMVRSVELTNQFGDQVLTTVEAEYLVVPAEKDAEGEPGACVAPPAGQGQPCVKHADCDVAPGDGLCGDLQHFLCYDVLDGSGFGPVGLEDQFGAQAVDVLSPRYFCNPVQKTLPNCCDADLDGNGTVDLTDFTILASCLAGGPIELCDVDCDGSINVNDQNILACQLGTVPPDPSCCPNALPAGVYPIEDAEVHLTCYDTDPKLEAGVSVSTNDQLDQSALQIHDNEMLCVPSTRIGFSVIPEPGALAQLATGVALLTLLAGRRSRRAAFELDEEPSDPGR